MADINQYKIIKELFTGEQLTVYQVEDTKSGEPGVLRLIHQIPLRDAWNELYRDYEARVTTYKHLPVLKTLGAWEREPFAVLDGSEGAFLENGQILTGKQIDQLLEAVVHLHDKKIYHGKITRFNIWVKEAGDITLYGAGERAVFQPDRKITIQDDLKQVISILKGHSTIAESYLEGQSFDSILELHEWILRKLSIPKPGLVEKGESSKTVFGGLNLNKDKNEREEQKRAVPAPEPVLVPPKKKQKSLYIAAAAAALLIVVIFSINWLRGGSEKTSAKVIETKQETAVGKEKQKAKPMEKREEADLSQFSPLFSGWDIIQHTSIKLSGTDYELVAAAHKQDDASSIVKISVLSGAKNGGWTKVWESHEYKGNSSETKSNIDSFLTITSENGQKGLLVFELPDQSGFISEVIAITVQANGSAEEVWSDYANEVEQNKNIISVTGTELSMLSLKNNTFTVEKTNK